MIMASGLELRAGARLLIEAASFQVAAGDKIGLVGRNGAGKTTLLRVLAGESQPAAGTMHNNETIGYLPQDTRTGDLDALATDRILQARGLDELLVGMREAELSMADANPARRDAAVNRYSQLEERLTVLGGYAAEAEAAALASSLGLPVKVLRQPLRTLSGGQRRRVELARILFGGASTLMLDEPTNHLDADSVAWLRDHLRGYRGGLIVISHNTDLLTAVVSKVFHLDADQAELEIYNVGWKAYLDQRETDARRRRRERANAERQPAALPACDSPSLPTAGRCRSQPRACPSPTARLKYLPTSISQSTRAQGSWCLVSTARAKRRCSDCLPGSSRQIPAKSCPGMDCGSGITPRSTRPSITSELCLRT